MAPPRTMARRRTRIDEGAREPSPPHAWEAPAPSLAADSPLPRSTWAAAAVLAAATLVLYAGVRGHAFLHFDDDLYVTDNPQVLAGLGGRGVAWALTTLHAANWHPLTWLSHMADVTLFGLEPGAHHLVNAAIHAVNAGLLLLVLARLTGAPARSAAAALLFAVHPLRVEAVAWVAERKELLGALFGLLMLAAYVRYARRPSARRYLLVLAAFAASLLSKPTWVTAPFLLLLLDVWPLRRLALPGTRGPPADPGAPAAPARTWGALLLEKLPLLAISAAVSVLVVIAQRRGGAVASFEQVGLCGRAANAIVSVARYLGNTLWPSRLGALYPWPPGGWGAAEIAGAAALVALLTGLALWGVRRWPFASVGWCWFLGALVPMIGLVQVGSQAMADRYTYLPGIGLTVGIVWSIAAAIEERGRTVRAAVGIAALAAAAALALVTARQVGAWHDQETLFRQALAVTGPNPRAHLILSQALAAQGRYLDALGPAREAVRLDPAAARARKNLGFVLYRAGLLDEAIPELEAAVALDPGYAEAHGNLAIAYGRKGRFEDAAREMRLEQQLRAAPSRR